MNSRCQPYLFLIFSYLLCRALILTPLLWYSKLQERQVRTAKLLHYKHKDILNHSTCCALTRKTCSTASCLPHPCPSRISHPHLLPHWLLEQNRDMSVTYSPKDGKHLLPFYKERRKIPKYTAGAPKALKITSPKQF